jgi:hypothetical protein
VVIVRAALEAPAVISGFDDIAVVSEAIEQCGRHFGVGEHARPFALIARDTTPWLLLRRRDHGCLA